MTLWIELSESGMVIFTILLIHCQVTSHLLTGAVCEHVLENNQTKRIPPPDKKMLTCKCF